MDTKESESGFGRYSFDLALPVDGKRLWGLSGTEGMIRIRHHLNNFGEDDIGEAQFYSNIDASGRTTLYEAWIEQRLFAEKFRLKFGKIDANTEFASVQTAGDFLNSSMGYSPTILAFPTYPEPKFGFNAFYHPTTNETVGFGIFKISNSVTLTIVEPARIWSLGRSEKPGRASFGYWHLHGTLAHFDGQVSSGTNGFYGVMEQTLWRGSPEGSHDRRFSAFLQFGSADERISPYHYHFGAGTVLQGINRRRSQDSAGVATTWVRFSSQPRAWFEYQSEMIFEAYYKAHVSSHVALIQDFQFLHHPGGLRINSDCPVITPRVVITF